MNAIEYPTLHILIYGEPYSGKSSFNASMPIPHLIFFFDPYDKDAPYLQVPGSVVQEVDDQGAPLLNLVGCPMKRVWLEQRLLFQIEYFHEGKWVENPRSGIAPETAAFEKFAKRLVSLDNGELEMWNTISIDSLTYLSNYIKIREKYKISPGGQYDIRHWAGGARQIVEEVIMVRFAMFPCNIVLLCHEKMYEHEKTKEIIRTVETPGTLGPNLLVGFGELYRMVNDPVNNKRMLQTQSDRIGWKANSKYAPNPCEPNYQYCNILNIVPCATQ